MKQIKIEIKLGKIKSEFFGFEGKKCDEMANKINKNLHLDILEKHYKEEANFESSFNQENSKMEW